MTSLREHLADLVKRWDGIYIRVQQDEKWQSLSLSEIRDGNQILDWIKESEGRFWSSKEAS